MNIQIITYNIKKFKMESNITVSDISSPKSLDEFDINIVDISSKELWKYKDGSRCATLPTIDQIGDFYSIREMVLNSNNAKVIYIFPQNHTAYWDKYDFDEKYFCSKKLKDILSDVIRIVNHVLPIELFGGSLVYENTRTEVGTKNVEADFCFKDAYNFTSLSKSIKSNKITTIELIENCYITTLDIADNIDVFAEFLKVFNTSKDSVEIPEWINNITLLDDEAQHKIINDNNNVIVEAQNKIKNAEDKLQLNLKYKSILYTNGNKLVEIVFEILERILDADLSDFIDVLKEDFLLKFQDITFIGEIKGISTNVKNDNISQLVRHYWNYKEELEEKSIGENVKGLLIINPFRNKDINEREPIHQNQIHLAERDGCLIIETYTLLKIFEMHEQGKINSEHCIEIFSKEEGLLDIETVKAFISK